MRLLFIQGGSRVRVGATSFFVDGNFNNKVWNRYKKLCDELIVILRKDNGIYNDEELKDKFNEIDTDLVNLKLVEDVYKPRINFFRNSLKKEIEKLIEEEVKKSDRVIIRSIGNFYTNTALKYCKKYNKKYLIEVTGFAFEGLWYHSLFGKILAIPREFKLKFSIKNAPYATYVTEYSLQKRYPNKGINIGCSDVELLDANKEVLLDRISKINKYANDKIYTLGTASFLNVKWKGIQDVLKVLFELKKIGINNFRYELIGAGDTKYLRKLIKIYSLENEVRILGEKKHEQVFEWVKNIDIYVQPSYQEGLCRAIVEAMFMALPIICSNAGGNVELIDKEYVFKKGNLNQLKKILISKINEKDLLEQANMNFYKAQKYEKKVLDKKREEFYKIFMEGNNNDKYCDCNV